MTEGAGMTDTKHFLAEAKAAIASGDSLNGGDQPRLKQAMYTKAAALALIEIAKLLSQMRAGSTG